jgi:oxygen-independent coproporphyrinogen-3 oxidase
VQDQNLEVQKAVHRIQPPEMNERVIQWIREAGFSSINIDLIYGLPKQTAASFEKTLDDIMTLRPDRLAIFNFAYVPWLKRAQKILKIIPPEEKMAILKMTIEKLTSSGYVYIGMDHFALENDELSVAQRQGTLQRNFQGYSTHGGADIYGFGMSSISQTESAYWQNQKELKPYYGAIDGGKSPMNRGYILSDDDKMRRQTIMTLMCTLKMDYAAMSKQLGVDVRSYYAKEIESLKPMEADGLIVRNERGLAVTDAGRLFLRNIAMQFDAYLGKGKAERFSKTV